MTAVAGTIGTSWMSTAAGSTESDSRKVSNSREDSNIPQGHQQKQHELATTTLATSRRQQQKGDPQQKGCQKYVVEMPTTVLASAGTPTAQ